MSPFLNGIYLIIQNMGLFLLHHTNCFENICGKYCENRYKVLHSTTFYRFFFSSSIPYLCWSRKVMKIFPKTKQKKQRIKYFCIPFPSHFYLLVGLRFWALSGLPLDVFPAYVIGIGKLIGKSLASMLDTSRSMQ